MKIRWLCTLLITILLISFQSAKAQEFGRVLSEEETQGLINLAVLYDTDRRGVTLEFQSDGTQIQYEEDGNGAITQHRWIVRDGRLCIDEKDCFQVLLSGKIVTLHNDSGHSQWIIMPPFLAPSNYAPRSVRMSLFRDILTVRDLQEEAANPITLSLAGRDKILAQRRSPVLQEEWRIEGETICHQAVAAGLTCYEVSASGAGFIFRPLDSGPLSFWRIVPRGS